MTIRALGFNPQASPNAHDGLQAEQVEHASEFSFKFGIHHQEISRRPDDLREVALFDLDRPQKGTLGKPCPRVADLDSLSAENIEVARGFGADALDSDSESAFVHMKGQRIANVRAGCVVRPMNPLLEAPFPALLIEESPLLQRVV